MSEVTEGQTPRESAVILGMLAAIGLAVSGVFLAETLAQTPAGPRLEGTIVARGHSWLGVMRRPRLDVVADTGERRFAILIADGTLAGRVSWRDHGDPSREVRLEQETAPWVVLLLLGVPSLCVGLAAIWLALQAEPAPDPVAAPAEPPPFPLRLSLVCVLALGLLGALSLGVQLAEVRMHPHYRAIFAAGSVALVLLCFGPWPSALRLSAARQAGEPTTALTGSVQRRSGAARVLWLLAALALTQLAVLPALVFAALGWPMTSVWLWSPEHEVEPDPDPVLD